MKIETPEQHEAQLMRLEQLMKLNPALNTPEDVEIENLAVAIEVYENIHYPLNEKD
ncbi:TPA: hypothetical protein PXO68_003166 [Yersinia enterocolitica]|uniref:hypothetical protein n=1 Tax=Yersinia enterocolitica TaxID=630 RepID=UPI0029B10E21|nr:hypothetical protein [Yersinia enterocolitica]ELX2238815.1 hypothetical protein [Yersinia enterocolitica]ELY5242019.1 hypothetical protein [Yersinia enterocolitica]HDL7601574.1 hypothetical protein [Yersinia enterocolitica]HDL7609413.1 hypothetical protein [Yersinia enterocolitica]